MIVGVTGHRDVEQQPGELLGFARLSVALMQQRGATEIITGMARGWDLAVARAAHDAGVPYCAAIPFASQPDRWPEHERVEWAQAVNRAARMVVIGTSALNVFLERRNCWIVNNSDELWSLWSGRSGGTAHCVLYAGQMGATIRPLWEPWLRYRAERT